MNKRAITFIFVLFLLVVLYEKGLAQLQVGDEAPVFSALDDSNKEWILEKYLGKKVVVVYFYPAAMTGGCTKQACSYRDHSEEMESLNALVVGISGDEVENLKYFKEAHNLNFPLLSDPDGDIAKAFGVPLRDGGSIVRTIDGEDKTLNRGVTTSRWTFIIDKEGKIAYVDTEVNAEKDTESVIAKIKAM